MLCIINVTCHIYTPVLATDEAAGLALAVLSLSPLSDGASVSVQVSSDAGVSTFFSLLQ